MYVPHERRAVILRLLEQRGSVRTTSLADELHVTEETIRTDIIALQKQKLLRRVHGGALYIPPGGGEDDGVRADCQLIDRLLPHLTSNCTLYIDPCTLTRALCTRLGALECRLLLVEPAMFSLLSSPTQPQEVIIPGGKLDKETKLIRPFSSCARFLEEHRVDGAILSPDAIPAPGQMAYHHELRAHWAAAAASAANRCVVLAPASAFNETAQHIIRTRRSLYITENNLPESFADEETELIPFLDPHELLLASQTDGI